MELGRALLNRFLASRKPQGPDMFDRRLGMLQFRVLAPMPAAGRSVFRILP
jgi:hypothetical protein